MALAGGGPGETKDREGNAVDPCINVPEPAVVVIIGFGLDGGDGCVYIYIKSEFIIALLNI